MRDAPANSASYCREVGVDRGHIDINCGTGTEGMPCSLAQLS